MKDFFNIIRWPNLLMIVVIQALVFYFLMDHMGSMLYLEEAALLILITLLIGAAGYVINDYYDSAIDKINKPEEWIAGNTWSLTRTLNVYKVLVATGAVLALFLAYRLDMLI